MSDKLHDHVTGFDIRGRMLDHSEVIAGRVVEEVSRHGASLASLPLVLDRAAP